jgi:hypothetical protein
MITMKSIFSMLLILACHFSYSHPGIGIVRDSKGNTYYTDLVHVWKLSANGKRSIAVPHVHTHELYIDANDNLYGEHLWYNGERVNTWGHYVWHLGSNNKLDTVIGPSAGFLKNYSFVRDGNGNMYWAERDVESSIKKRSHDGEITTIYRGKFTDIRWMHVTKKGILYFIDLDHLYKIASGKLHLIAKNISNNTPAFKMYRGKHSLLGIWTDKAENVYVANFSGQIVKRISPKGKIENVVYSTTPWSPTGGTFDNEGNLWLLEYSLTNEARVRKILLPSLSKGKTTPVIVSNYILPVSIVVLIVSAIIFLARILFLKGKVIPASTG